MNAFGLAGAPDMNAFGLPTAQRPVRHQDLWPEAGKGKGAQQHHYDPAPQAVFTPKGGKGGPYGGFFEVPQHQHGKGGQPQNVVHADNGGYFFEGGQQNDQNNFINGRKN